MKKTYTLLLLLLSFIVSCQNEDNLQNNATGYLRLQMGINTYVETKAYDPEQIAVQIISADGEVVKETSDWTEWQGEQIALAVGTYTIKASSAGFDGNSGSQPYYAGSETIHIEKDKEVNAKITCTLANVKVTVKFDDSFKKYFTTAQVTVDDLAGSSSVSPQTFNMTFDTEKSVYFPVTDLSALVQVANRQGVQHQQTDEITGVKARDHYILTYKVGEGEGGVNIKVDPSYKIYEYTFEIPTEPSTQLATPTANAWAKFAYINGNVISSKDELDASKMTFQYRKKNTEDWTTVKATKENDNYQATLLPLDANTTYECRMAYNEEEFTSRPTEFTTEEATLLPNGNFDNWSTVKAGLFGTINTAFPNASASDAFWDTSNKGANSLSAQDPTSEERTIVHSGSAAKLESKSVASVFAAASLYTGEFLTVDFQSFGAEINFGQPFTARPIALEGYYKYIPQNVDNIGSDLPSGTLTNGQPDQCAIYIALSKKAYTVNNKDTSTFIDFENDENIIAYGSIPSGAATEGDGYVKFNIPLEYRTLNEKPSYIIIVCSSSKYGDYMSGAVGSTLYVDDFELIYDGTPAQ